MANEAALLLALEEATLCVSWRFNKERVREYISVSTASYASTNPDRSWCGDFAYWALLRAGIQPLPPLAKIETYNNWGKTYKGWNTVARFGATYEMYDRSMQAAPGDMYYMRYTTHAKLDAGVATDHVGFVFRDDGGPTFESVDGNSGGSLQILAKGIGGGYVCLNTRDRDLVTYFIRMP